LLTSDRHWDNPKSDWDLQKFHLDQALEHNAQVIDAGDWFCLMQGKFDPRSSKGGMRPEHDNPDYLGSVIETAVDFFEPYAKNIAVIGKGNHEESILQRQGLDMNSHFVGALNERAKTNIVSGGLRGFVFFRCFDDSGNGQTKVLHYYHGAGGGGVVTKGTLQPLRVAAVTPDADIVMSGHIHEQWMFPIQRMRVSKNGVVSQDRQLHLCCPTYKEEFGDGSTGWHNLQMRPPKPLGAWWLKLYRRNKEIKIHVEAAEI